jgi:hypothetical protein
MPQKKKFIFINNFDPVCQFNKKILGLNIDYQFIINIKIENFPSKKNY